MRKIKLLLAAMAAMVSLGVQAGSDWVAPSAPSATDPESGGTYKIRNVGSGQYLAEGAAWFSWSTSAVLKDVNSALEWTISGSNEAGYTLACNRSGNNKLFTSGNDNAEQCMHVDGANAGTYFFEKQPSGYYRIRQSGIEGKYVGGPDGSNGVLAQVDPSNPSVASISCDWEFVPLSALTTYGPIVAYAAMRESVLAYINMTDIYTDANDAVTTLRNGVYAQDDIVDAATTAEEVNNATAAVRALILPFISTVTIKDGKSFNITDFITNPSFESSFTGWTNSGMSTQGNNSFAGKVGSTYAEAWQPNGTKSVSQTLSGLPAGYYTLSANILARTVTSAKLYAGSSEVFATIADASNPYSVVFNCEDNANITIGFEGVGTGAGASWLAVDNFGLTYLGKTPLVLFQNELAEAVSNARSHASGLTIPTAALTAYNNAINAAEANNGTVEDCQDGVAAIATATETADAFVAPYAAYNTQLANATFAGVAAATISEQNDAVAAATEVDAVVDAANALKSATNALAFDITSFTITNASAQSKDGWDGTNFGGQSNGVTEYWNVSPAGFSQTITALPAGKYLLTVTALQRLNMTGTVYAGENNATIAQVGNPPVNNRAQAADWFAAGNGLNYVTFTLTETSDVTIGLRADETIGDHWTVWQGFKLATFTESVAASYLAPGYASLVEEATATYNNAAYANVTGTEKTNFAAAIAANPETVIEYQAAIEAINTTSAAFTAAATSYDKYVAYKAESVALWGTDFDVAAPTTAAEAVTAVNALNVAQYNKVATDYKYSLTGKIGEFSTWTKEATSGGAEDTPQTLSTEHFRGNGYTYYEQGVNGWASNSFTVDYSKTATLPAGNYVIKVATRASANVTGTVSATATANTVAIANVGAASKGITTAGVASFDEGEFVNGGNGFGWEWRFLPFTVAEEGNVIITIHAESSSEHGWVSIADAELLSDADKSTKVDYDEAANNTIEDVDVATVTITRTIKEGFNTVCLPFSLTAGEVATAFGTGSEVYTFSENSADPMDATINFNKGDGSITANVPVLVKAVSASTEQVFSGVQILAPTADAKVEGKNFDFVGVYAPQDIDEGDWFLNGSDIYKATDKTQGIKAFRAYFQTKGEASSVKLYIEGIETSIRSINGLQARPAGVIYNLAGQRMQKAQKGINIVNGKKVVIR